MEKTGCEVICGAPMTLAVKGMMTMMMKYSGVDSAHKKFSDLEKSSTIGSVPGYHFSDGLARVSRPHVHHTRKHFIILVLNANILLHN